MEAYKIEAQIKRTSPKWVKTIKGAAFEPHFLGGPFQKSKQLLYILMVFGGINQNRSHNTLDQVGWAKRFPIWAGR